MKLGGLTKGWKGALLGTLVVLGGVATAFVTVWARRVGDIELSRVGAIMSLVFVLLMLVFVVPPLARSARVEAAGLDLPLQVTGGGLVFLLVLGVVAFAAWNTGNNLLFLVFALMTSTVFVGWSAGRVSLRDLVVTARFPDHIFAGEPAPAIVTVENLKRLHPSYSVLVEARSRGEVGLARRLLAPRRARQEKRALAYFAYVPRRAKAEQMVAQTFERRGRVQVTGFEVSTRFPFGFFRVRRRLRARDVEIVVYPRPRPAGDELHLLPANAGRMASARRGVGHDLHSLRDYQPRDDVRRIDWKATARSDRLTVREFTAEDERRVHVALDTRLGEGDAAQAAERFERGVVQAASLLAHFVDERAEVSLTLGAEGGRYGEGREHLYECLRRLALVAPDAGANDDAGARASFWEAMSREAAATRAGGSFRIILTAAAPGTVPAQVWRASHVIHL